MARLQSHQQTFWTCCVVLNGMPHHPWPPFLLFFSLSFCRCSRHCRNCIGGKAILSRRGCHRCTLLHRRPLGAKESFVGRLHGRIDWPSGEKHCPRQKDWVFVEKAGKECKGTRENGCQYFSGLGALPSWTLGPTLGHTSWLELPTGLPQQLKLSCRDKGQLDGSITSIEVFVAFVVPRQSPQLAGSAG